MAKVQCLTCGGMAELGKSTEGTCPYCGCRVTLRRLSSFNTWKPSEVSQLKGDLETKGNATVGLSQGLALALCYLKLGNVQQAEKSLSTLVVEHPESGEACYYYALCLLYGKTLSALTLPEAKIVTGYLQTASSLNSDNIFPRLLYGLLCIEYYDGNGLIPPEDGKNILKELQDQEVDAQELDFLRHAVHSELL